MNEYILPNMILIVSIASNTIGILVPHQFQFIVVGDLMLALGIYASFKVGK